MHQGLEDVIVFDGEFLHKDNLDLHIEFFESHVCINFIKDAFFIWLRLKVKFKGLVQVLTT